MKEGQDISAVAGSNKDVNCQVAYSDGTPYDLTTDTIAWVVAVERGATPFLTKTLASGAIVPVHVIGTVEVPAEFQIHILPVDTEALAGMYWHECKLVKAGFESPIFGGQFIVKASST